MAQDGTAIFDIFYRIPTNPVPGDIVLDLPTNKRHCCNDFFLDYLADASSTDEFKNDVIGPHYWFPDVITEVEITLWKDGLQTAVLSDNTYGTLKVYGESVNDQGESISGYQLEFKKVIDLHGAGQYKLKFDASCDLDFIGGIIETPTYCLRQYQPDVANGTVRLEYNINNIIGTSKDDTKKRDYMNLNWYNSYRIKGWFGFPSAELTENYTQLNSGQRIYTKSELEPEYILQLKPISQFLHDILKIDFMQADVREVTDYNYLNTNNYIQKRIKPASGYSPNWRIMKNKLAPVEVKFNQEFNNLKKLRC